MTLSDKKKKAVAIAVAYFLEEEKKEAAALEDFKARNMWVSMGKEIIMQNRAMVQRRGRVLPSR